MTVPPLIAIAEGRRARPRKGPLMRESELRLHSRVVSLLRVWGCPEWRWTHIPSGEKSEPRTAAKLKMMGVARGWPDLVLIGPDSRFHGLELKRDGGRLSEDQQGLARWCATHGAAFSCADSFKGAVAVLKQWGALREVKHG